jgi:hypothetical protein
MSEHTLGHTLRHTFGTPWNRSQNESCSGLWTLTERVATMNPWSR